MAAELGHKVGPRLRELSVLGQSEPSMRKSRNLGLILRPICEEEEEEGIQKALWNPRQRARAPDRSSARPLAGAPGQSPSNRPPRRATARRNWNGADETEGGGKEGGSNHGKDQFTSARFSCASKLDRRTDGRTIIDEGGGGGGSVQLLGRG